jgi:hypothetical protein
VPSIGVSGIGGLVTLRGFLNKLSYEDKILQEKGAFWRIASNFEFKNTIFHTVKSK